MTTTMQDEVYAFDWAPLLAHLGQSNPTPGKLLPINLALQAEHCAGGVRLTFPDGFQTTMDGSGRNGVELFEHLRRLLMMAGQWPAR